MNGGSNHHYTSARYPEGTKPGRLRPPFEVYDDAKAVDAIKHSEMFVDFGSKMLAALKAVWDAMPKS